MQVTEVQVQIDELHRKLDVILAEMEHQRRHRLEMEDLKADLAIVLKDLYQTAVQELEELSAHVRPGDLVYLFKKLLRNANNLARAFDQLESLRDLLADLKIISKELYAGALVKLDELDRKGYFELAKKARAVADDTVELLLQEDLDGLRASLPRLAAAAKAAAKPATLEAVERLARGFERARLAQDEDPSLWKLLKELNTPEARRGLRAFVEIVKALGEASDSPAGHSDGAAAASQSRAQSPGQG